MKKQIFHCLLAITGTAGITLPASAQTITPATNVDIGAMLNVRPETINADMFAYRFNIGNPPVLHTGNLTAIVWDDYTNPGTAESYLMIYNEWNGDTEKVQMPQHDARHPDVVIGSTGSLTQCFIGVVYEWKNTIQMAVYRSTLTASVANLTLQYSFALSTAPVNCRPHIDIRSANTSSSTTPPLIREFVACWQTGTAGSFGDPQAAFGDIVNAPSFSVITFASGLNGKVRNIDVGCFNGTTDSAAFVFEYDNTTNTQIRELNQEVSTTAGISTGTTLATAAPTDLFGIPRIDCQTFPASGNKWMAIVPQRISPATNLQAYTYANSGTTVNFSVAPLSTTTDYTNVAVAGGQGSVGGGWGSNFYNQNYSFMVRPDSDPKAYVRTRAVPSAPGGIYYETNLTGIPVIGSVPVAVGTSSNGGNGMVSAWFNPAPPKPGVFYKITGTTIVFRPTNVGALSGNSEIKLYPNPASNAITIEGIQQAGYLVTDMAGRILLSGTVTNKETIDVTNLPLGEYVLQLNEGGITTARRFGKE